MHQQQMAFENTVGKGEIACNKQFLLFPQCFLLNQKIVSPFVHIFDIISLFAPEFEKHKIDISGKGLKKRKYKGRRTFKILAENYRLQYIKHLRRTKVFVIINSLPHSPNFQQV